MTAAEYHAVTAKPKGANDTEAAFGERLRLLHRDGVITEPRFEAVKLPLLPPCGKGKRTITFTPDWTFWPSVECFVDTSGITPWDRAAFTEPDAMEISEPEEMMFAVDCKGFQREDAWLKIRLAACLYPDIAFFIVRRVRGGWKWERVRGGELGVEVDW